MVAKIDQLSRMLGGIEAQLTTVLRVQSEDRQSAAQYRTDIRAELKSVSHDVQSIQTDMRIVNGRISKVEPVVKLLEENRLMSAGATKLGGVIGRFGHIISGAAGAVMAIMFSHWINRP